MPSWPGVVAAAAGGAYAFKSAQEFQVTDVVRGFARNVTGADFGPAYGSNGMPSPVSGGLSVLQGENDKLHQLISELVKGNARAQPPGFTVIHAGGEGRKGWSVLIVPVAVAGGVLYVYLRFRGWRVTDFMPVTRGSLNTLRTTVIDSCSKIWDEVRRSKEDFLSKLTGVARQQEALNSQQAAMDERLASVGANVNAVDERLHMVGNNVEDIRDSTQNISSRVELLDDRMGSVLEEAQRANRGIMLLCTSVASITRRVGLDNSKDNALLHTYLQSGAGYGHTNAGLGSGPAYPALEAGAGAAGDGGGGARGAGGGGGLSSAQSLPVLTQRGLGSLVGEVAMPNSSSAGQGLRDGAGESGGQGSRERGQGAREGGQGASRPSPGPTAFQLSDSDVASPQAKSHGSPGAEQRKPPSPARPPVAPRPPASNGVGVGYGGGGAKSRSGMGSGSAAGGTLPPPASSTTSSGSSSSFHWPVSYGFRS
ncbi:MAG: hypothetical protein WDW36_000652 [Sanguina aurantia]